MIILSNSDFYIEHNFLPTKTQMNLSDEKDYSTYKSQRLFLLENLLSIQFAKKKINIVKNKVTKIENVSGLFPKKGCLKSSM